jgi:hypothetical protein
MGTQFLNIKNKCLNVFLILKNIGSKKHEFRQAGTGVPASRNRSSSEIAGISPYNGKSVNYSLFTYRQLFIDMVELSAYAVSGTLPGRRGITKASALVPP